ncbi:unnamed protein product [Sphagnum troendelagicum]
MQYRFLAAYLPCSRSLLLVSPPVRKAVVYCSDASVNSSTRLSACSQIAHTAVHQEVLQIRGGDLRSRARHRQFCVQSSSTSEQVSMEGDGIEPESTGSGVDLKQSQQPLSSRDDMSDSYGAGYSTRSSDEGFGQIYSTAAKAVKERKMARETAEEEEEEDSEVDIDPKAHREFDRTQGSHVAQKEAARHSEHENAFENESAAHRRKDANIANK